MTYHLTSRHICDDSSSSALRKALDYGNVKSALNVDNRCKESMSSLSSSSSSSNSTQRTPVTSSLPGGSDNSIFGSHMYNCGNRSNKFLLKEKVFNPHAAKHSSGPIKADHSINITSNNFLIRKEKHGSLKPIPRQKSCSLSDLSICNTRSVADTDMKYADDEKSGQTDVNQHRSNSLRSFVSDMRTYSETFPKKVEETLRNSLKSKALLNQRSCENQLYQPFEKVVDSVKNFSSLVHDKLPVNVKSNRQYCSLSDLNTNTKNDVRIVGSLNCELVGKNEAKHDNEKRNGVCINLSKSAAVKKEKEVRNFAFSGLFMRI